MALFLAWVAFWVNTAFIPCCAAFAAEFDNRADDVMQSVSAASQTHTSNEPRVQHPHCEPDSPCGPAVNAEPATNGEYEALLTQRVDPEWDATYVLVAGRIATDQSADFALHDYRPPPANIRLYLQTQRLLI